MDFNMISVSKDWNPKQALLKEMLSKPNQFKEGIELCLELHSLVHTAETSNVNYTTYEDELWDGLSEDIFRGQVKKKSTTIAWNLWHITRIEDITVNILIADERQVLNPDWRRKLKTEVLDTGNAMTDQEIADFSSCVDMKELRNYRIQVGRKTQGIIQNLKPSDLKRKMTEIQLNRIISEGGVLKLEGSIGLIDFWGRKTVAGLLLMPVTRHQIVHINDSLKIKEK